MQKMKTTPGVYVTLLPTNDPKMEEKNPLEITSVTLPQQSLQNNKRGRPLAAKVVKFTPQPKSIISRFLRKVRKESCDDVNEINRHNIHNNISNSNFNLDNDANYKKKSAPDEGNTFESIQGNFTFDLTILENDPIDHDSLKDNCLMEDKEENNYQSTYALWDKKCESETKLIEIACYVCSYRSTSQKEHRKHLSTHRNQPYACNFPNCKYTCKLSCNLIKHKRIHTSEKPYLCDQCTFRSNFANSLKVHKRIHTCERPYCCEHCSYRCNSSSNLKKHCVHKHRNMYSINK